MKLSFLKIYSILSMFFVFPLVALLLTPKTYAEDQQFTINYDINYEISENGDTVVNQTARIVNLKNDVIPTTYTFSARQLKIYDVSAITNGKNSEPRIEEKGDETFISVTISNYAIGEGQENKIDLVYKTKSIAGKSGKIWNIYIPKIQIPETTVIYNVKLLIPASFGSKIYLSPTPVIEKKEDNSTAFYFTKESFKSTGIVGAFGEYQPLNFKLKYHLDNSSILPSVKEISLPPDINEIQSVNYQNISPKPIKIRTDPDGNFIATYILAPFKKINIEVIGTARIYGKQINTDFGRSFSEIPLDLIKKYTKTQKYWEVNSPYIQKLSEELKKDDLNVIKNAQKIYDFITKNLTYNYAALEEGLVERQGAEKALIQKGSWTCMEFTDLFIATSRAMGIPAREINGYAFTFEDQNKPVSINFNGGDLLHSWAEFYDPFYGWVPVDPTWGTTSGIDYFSKLDNNHFAFVVKGLSSQYPFPAGTYRLSDDEKLIDIAVSQNLSDENFIPRLEAKSVLNLNPFQLLQGNKKIKVINTGGLFIYHLEGKNIPLGESVNIFIDKKQMELRYEDINGKKYTLSL